MQSFDALKDNIDIQKKTYEDIQCIKCAIDGMYCCAYGINDYPQSGMVSVAL